MVELVDTTDLKSVGRIGRIGSSPIPGTYLMMIGSLPAIGRKSDPGYIFDDDRFPACHMQEVRPRVLEYKIPFHDERASLIGGFLIWNCLDLF